MKSKQLYVILSLMFLIAATSGIALANDKIISSIILPGEGPVPVIEDNGVSSGTIRLNYTYVGTQVQCQSMPFAYFDLKLAAEAGTGLAGSYPADLKLSISGSGTPVQLSPSPNYFSVGGTSFTNSSKVEVYIDCSKLRGDLLDGDVIDGQLNERVTMQGTNKNAHIDTITTIQVHIKLVVPTSCLKLYSFETNQDTGDILTDPFVVIPNKHDGTVNSTSPAGQCCPNV